MARASDRRRFLESTAAWAALVALRPDFAVAANLPRKAITFSARLPRGTPQEVACYVDASASPLVKASFGMSRTVFYARPQDCIRTLDARLVNVRGSVSALESAEVRDALHEITYPGLLTTNVAGAAA
jgi:hypothetical protein